MPSGSSHHLHPPSDEDSALGSLPPDEFDDTRSGKRPLANINPFTPDGKYINLLFMRHTIKKNFINYKTSFLLFQIY